MCVCICGLARVEPRGWLTWNINLTWAHIHMLQYKCKRTHTRLSSLQRAEVPTSKFLITSTLITQAILNTSHDLCHTRRRAEQPRLQPPPPNVQQKHREEEVFTESPLPSLSRLLAPLVSVSKEFHLSWLAVLSKG